MGADIVFPEEQLILKQPDLSVGRNEVVRVVNQEFYNQIESFPWATVGRRSCGPTAFAMGINILNNRGNSKGMVVTPQEIMWDASTLTKLPASSEQNYLEITQLDGSIGLIPIGNTITETILEDIKADQEKNLKVEHKTLVPIGNEYDPIFTLSRGWDHRGSQRIMEKYGFYAEKVGDVKPPKYEFSHIIRNIQRGNVIVGSVERSADSTHVVLISDYNKDEAGVEWLLISDPMENQPEWKEAQEWYSKSFRGYGTVIHRHRFEDEELLQ